MDEPTGGTTHNRISDNALVIGGVVQAGTFTGQVHFHYCGNAAPLDLFTLRRWVERVAADYRALTDAVPEHVRHVDSVRAHLADSAGEGEQDLHRNGVRRLLVAGICGYVARAGQAPRVPLPEQVLLDLVVFALWPVITARRLPPGWQGELAELTSPRLAALVDLARSRWRPGDGEAAEAFARSVARRSLHPAMAALFDDLADPRRGGALLTSMALVGGLPQPTTEHPREVFAWVVGLVGGGAALAVVLDPDSRVRRAFEEAVTGLPDGSLDFDAAELLECLAEAVNGLFE